MDKPRSAPSVAPGDALEQEAIRRRLTARLFGEPCQPIQIGRFRVGESLGRGGMGVVYAAEDDRLGRRVAIKVIRETAQHVRERARLLAEARAQARLSHPNVVNVYEVGEDGDSVFIVMELVRGVTLDAWLRARPRSLANILAVFRAAGHGLAAAHAAGLVHRDIKPGNILVGDDGRVRIADFGLARGADPEGSTAPSQPDSDSTVTRGAPRVSSSVAAGTPAYMSPEHRQGRTDARSDQFSYCVTLFESLFGHRPFVDDLFIMTVTPGSASMATPGSVPGWLRRLLARGLELDPRRRFPSMDALLAAYPADEHRAHRGLILGAAGLLGLSGSLGLGILGAVSPDPCAMDPEVFAGIWDVEARARVEAELRATGAPYAEAAWTQVAASFDSFVTRWHAARRDVCETVHIRGERSLDSLRLSERCLDRGRRALAERVAMLSQPGSEPSASIDAWLATIPDPEACRRDVDIAQLHAITPRPQVMIDLDRAHLAFQSRQSHAALPHVEAALAVASRLGDRAGEAEALWLRARVEAWDLGDARTAIASLDQAYERAVAASYDALVWRLWNELAVIHARDLEDASEARLWLGRARSALQTLSRPDPLAAAILLGTEARVVGLEGRHDEALQLRRDALAAHERLLPAGHPEVLEARQQVANALAERGALVEALAIQEELLAEQLERWGPAHPAAAALAFNTGLTHLELHDFAAARRRLLQARSVFVRVDGPTGTRAASVDLYLAQAAAGEGDARAAESLASAALAVFYAHTPDDHSERIGALALLAEIYRAEGRHRDSLRVVTELLALQDRHEDLDLDLPGLLTSIGDNLCILGRCGEALPAYTRLADHFTRHPPDNQALLAFPLQGMGRANLALGHPSVALPLFERALQLLRASSDVPLPVLAETANNLADCLKALGLQGRRTRELRRLAASVASDVARLDP